MHMWVAFKWWNFFDDIFQMTKYSKSRKNQNLYTLICVNLITGLAFVLSPFIHCSIPWIDFSHRILLSLMRDYRPYILIKISAVCYQNPKCLVWKNVRPWVSHVMGEAMHPTSLFKDGFLLVYRYLYIVDREKDQCTKQNMFIFNYLL